VSASHACHIHPLVIYIHSPPPPSSPCKHACACTHAPRRVADAADDRAALDETLRELTAQNNDLVEEQLDLTRQRDELQSALGKCRGDGALVPCISSGSSSGGGGWADAQ
jgi:hypothetical protein